MLNGGGNLTCAEEPKNCTASPHDATRGHLEDRVNMLELANRAVIVPRFRAFALFCQYTGRPNHRVYHRPDSRRDLDDCGLDSDARRRYSQRSRQVPHCTARRMKGPCETSLRTLERLRALRLGRVGCREGA